MIQVTINSIDAVRLRRNILLFLGLSFVLYLAYLVREIWLPLMIALLIAMVLDPVVDRMERRGWSRLKGAVVIYLAFFVVMGGTLGLAVPAIVSQTVDVTKKISEYIPVSANDTKNKRSLRHLLDKLNAAPFVQSTVLNASKQISGAFDKASSWVGKAAEGLVSNLLWIIIIPIVSFYALKDFHLILARLLMLVPRENRNFVQQLTNGVTAIFVRYLRGLVVVCALNAAATAGVLTLFRVFHVEVPNALALGAISGILYVVPYIGAALTIAIIAGTCLISGASVQMMLVVVATMIVLHHVIFDQIITPRVVGQHVGLHPILSIIALLAGGSLLGILGMILAVPFAATLQMIAVFIFPKLAKPIEIPTGEHLQEKAEELTVSHHSNTDEVEDAVDVHQTIVAAVDSAEDAEEEAERAVIEHDRAEVERIGPDATQANETKAALPVRPANSTLPATLS